MATGLVQWFSFTVMLGPYFNFFDVVTLGSKSIRFGTLKLECDGVVVSFAARLLGFTKSIHMLLSFTYINFFVNFSFSFDLLLIVFTKRFYFSLIIFKDSLALEQLLAKLERGLARWVRPAVEHAQDFPLVGEARSGV